MRFIFIILIFLNFSYSNEFESDMNDFFKDWDKAHNDKNIGLFDKLYLENVRYYNSKNSSKFQILEDKIRILKKYPEFKQSSKIISKEQISNELIKVNYEKDTFYNNKNRIYNSYLILDTSNEQLKIYEENDNKNIQTKINNIDSNIKNDNLVKEEKISSKEMKIANNEVENKKNLSNDIEDVNHWKSTYLDPDEIISIKQIAKKNPSKLEDWEYLYKNYNERPSIWIQNDFTNPVEIKAWLDTKYFDFVDQFNSYGKVHYVKDLKNVGIENPDELKKWLKVSDSSIMIKRYKNLNISIEDAIKWEKLNIPENKLKQFVELNIKPVEIEDLLPKTLSVATVVILRDLNMKPTPLIESMDNRLRIDTKETFIKFYNILVSNNCEQIEKIHFGDSDEYDNEGLCYFFYGKLEQRLNKNEGVMSSIEPSLLNDKKHTNSYVYFDGPWREDTYSRGIIKGLGSAKVNTVMGQEKIMRLGKVLLFSK